MTRSNEHTSANRLIVALDFPCWEDAYELVQAVPDAMYFKIGLEMYLASGSKAIETLNSMGKRVFLDLKFHDIPNTVAQACCQAALLGVDMINLHASGGPKMMHKAAADLASFTAQKGINPPKLIAVTILTSLDAAEMKEIGYEESPEKATTQLASLAKRSGLSGVVASPKEINQIRAACGKDFLIVCPGIRSADSPKDDQQRTLTAQEAIVLGADHIVVGRPITKASDPRKATLDILKEIELGLNQSP